MPTKTKKSTSRVSKASLGKKKSFKFRWWMAILLVLAVGGIGVAVLRFSHAASTTQCNPASGSTLLGCTVFFDTRYAQVGTSNNFGYSGNNSFIGTDLPNKVTDNLYLKIGANSNSDVLLKIQPAVYPGQKLGSGYNGKIVTGCFSLRTDSTGSKKYIDNTASQVEATIIVNYQEVKTQTVNISQGVYYCVDSGAIPSSLNAPTSVLLRVRLAPSTGKNLEITGMNLQINQAGFKLN